MIDETRAGASRVVGTVSGLAALTGGRRRWRGAPRALLAAGVLSSTLGCREERGGPPGLDGGALPSVLATAHDASTAGPAARPVAPLANLFAYIPPQCFTKTRGAAPASEAQIAKAANGVRDAGSAHALGEVHNPCYVCHTASVRPNAVNDADLQLALKLPAAAARNPWTNLFEPAVFRTPRVADRDLLAYVRTSNYFDANGAIALAAALTPPPPEWDLDGDGRFSGFVPDAAFRFDDRGFDIDPAGARTGWRAFAYAPFPGTFFPTNGSMDDVLVRLDPLLQQRIDGTPDPTTYLVNLAIVEALIAREDVAIDPVDERVLGLDVDLDGALGTATRVAFDGPGGARMHYAGRAREEQGRGAFPLSPGLFPLGTEFLHTVRYLDIGVGGDVMMARRMKEVRYAKKTRWFDPSDLSRVAAADAVEQNEAAYGNRTVISEGERGVWNGQGWLLQGFIEGPAGALRPQTYEETVYCAGCHGGVGATTDSTFAFARKLRDPSASQARGWYHWSQHDLHGTPEPRRRDGSYEYAFYLSHNGAADELRANGEVQARFFTSGGVLREDEVAALHADVTRLLLPSAGRALELDRAYQAVVREQSFLRGRDAVLAPAVNVYATAPVGAETGVPVALRAR